MIAGQSEPGADVAGVDDQPAGLDEQAVIDCVVIGADDRDIECGQLCRAQRGRAAARQPGMLAGLRQLGQEGVVKRDDGAAPLQATPMTSTRAPLIARPARSLSAAIALSMTRCGIAVLTSPANSIKRVETLNSRAFQVR